VLICGVIIASCGVREATNDSKKSNTVEVLTLGAFHFNFPNLDVEQTADEDKIDVLLPEYQKEIELIVKKLLVFQPTVVVIEQLSEYQSIIDAEYNQYLAGNYQLGRAEQEQIGYRIAKAMGLKKVYCADDFGVFTENITNLLNNQESEEFSVFAQSFEKNNSNFQFNKKRIFKTEGILAKLIQLNNEENIKKSLGYYLLDIFKHENTSYDFTGVDFETGRWFNRNLRIFRNIQRIETNPSDRILVIFGAEHLNILNFLFESSQEYTLLMTNDFLK
jgi:hypothetical protein